MAKRTNRKNKEAASAAAGPSAASQGRKRATKRDGNTTAASSAKTSSSKGTRKTAEKPRESQLLTGLGPQDLESEIRERAFQIFEQRGPQGDALSDWLQAEAEVKHRHGVVP